MIKYKGTTLYPLGLYDILNEIDFVDNYFIEVYTSSLGTDEILIKAGCKTQQKKNEKIIKDHFRAKLRVAPEIQITTPDQINRLQHRGMHRKPLIFSDKRTQPLKI